jgi:GNAT superfamily N-acetyltransferase
MGAVMRRSMAKLSEGFYNEAQAEAAAKYLTVPDPDLIEDGTSFVIESDGEIIACGAWSTRQKLYTGSEDQEALVDRVIPGLDAARIRAFFVDPAHARQGLAHALYDACAEAAMMMGFTDFELMATLPGVPFYERLGFLSMGVVDVELMDGTMLPCCPMSKSLF